MASTPLLALRVGVERATRETWPATTLNRRFSCAVNRPSYNAARLHGGASNKGLCAGLSSDALCRKAVILDRLTSLRDRRCR